MNGNACHNERNCEKKDLVYYFVLYGAFGTMEFGLKTAICEKFAEDAKHVKKEQNGR